MFAVVFVVDAADKDGLLDARTVLETLLSQEKFRHARLLVMANKQDLPGAVGALEVRARLELRCLTNNPVHVQECSAVTGEGVSEGFEWLAHSNEVFFR